MRKINLLLFVFIAINYSYSQKHELGKVTIEELNEKSHPIDSSAVAAILFKKGITKYSEDLNTFGRYSRWVVETKVSYKIKIYKKQGYEQANYSIPYYAKGNTESVSFSDAYTYNLVDGKIEKTKLTSSGIFTEKVNKDIEQKKITMPMVKEGSIIEFTYTIQTPNVLSLRDFQFQSLIPVKYVEYLAFIPNRFVFNTMITGYEKINMNSVKDYSNSNFQQNKHSYIGEDIPALIPESYVNNISNYFSTVKFNISAIKNENTADDNLALDWEQVSTRIYNSESFGDEMEKNAFYKEDLDVFLKDITDRNEKIKAIFKFIKTKVHWNEYYGVLCENGIKNAYKESKGNVADINLMLVSMLRYAQIDANPVLISTRNNGVAFVPSLSAFNYVVAGVEIENDIIFLDATSPYSSVNVLPIRDLNWIGRIVRKNNSSAEVNLIPKVFSSDVINVMATISSDGNLEGKVKRQYYDYDALMFRENNANITKENYIQSLEKNYNNLFIEEYNVEGLKDVEEPLIERFSFKNNNSVEIIDDKMYFSPMLFFAKKENPFKQENRNYPVDFIYPHEERYLINIQIPDGYKVESLPKSVAVSMSDDMIVLKYNIINTDRKIQLSVNLDYNSAIIAPDYYAELKAVFNEIIKKENEKIILKKL